MAPGSKNSRHQVTVLKPTGGGRRACRRLIGTYLTKNVAKGADGENTISRSLISLNRSGLILFHQFRRRR